MMMRVSQKRREWSVHSQKLIGGPLLLGSLHADGRGRGFGLAVRPTRRKREAARAHYYRLVPLELLQCYSATFVRFYTICDQDRCNTLSTKLLEHEEEYRHFRVRQISLRNTSVGYSVLCKITLGNTAVIKQDRPYSH